MLPLSEFERGLISLIRSIAGTLDETRQREAVAEFTPLLRNYILTTLSDSPRNVFATAREGGLAEDNQEIGIIG